MMKLTIPKSLKGFTIRQKRGSAQTFYVTSEKNPNEKYIVVGDNCGLFFCQCGDFFGRKLPAIIDGSSELCKHGQFVREAVEFLNVAQGKLDHAVKEHKHSTVITAVTKALTQPVPKTSRTPVVW